jgi:hypothetical protein
MLTEEKMGHGEVNYGGWSYGYLDDEANNNDPAQRYFARMPEQLRVLAKVLVEPVRR